MSATYLEADFHHGLAQCLALERLLKPLVRAEAGHALQLRETQVDDVCEPSGGIACKPSVEA